MAHRLVVKNFGPIKEADINVSDFMVLTGKQSSGKSTIAKLIYFFRTVKSEIQALYYEGRLSDIHTSSELEFRLTQRFTSLFRDATYDDTTIEYYYDKDTFIELTTYYKHKGSTFRSFIINESDKHKLFNFSFNFGISNYSKESLVKVFHDNLNTIFIPAGRSMLSLLSGQLVSFYSRMDDGQKNTIDLCTRHYIERIFTIQPEFKNGFASLQQFNLPKWKEQEALLDEAIVFIKDFLQGEYSYNNGNEVLRLSNGQAVAVNYMSSGQQESLWLLNILIYYMVKGNKAFFIIEEPESNLFPEWQKKIVEFIALAHNAGNQVLITTHSPYILAAVNNIAYASRLRKTTEVSVFPKEYNINNLSAYFADNKGNIINSIDAESGLIDNMLIDEISGELNEQFDALLDIELKEEN